MQPNNNYPPPSYPNGFRSGQTGQPTQPAVAPYQGAGVSYANQQAIVPAPGPEQMLLFLERQRQEQVMFSERQKLELASFMSTALPAARQIVPQPSRNGPLIQPLPSNSGSSRQSPRARIVEVSDGQSQAWRNGGLQQQQQGQILQRQQTQQQSSSNFSFSAQTRNGGSGSAIPTAGAPRPTARPGSYTGNAPNAVATSSHFQPNGFRPTSVASPTLFNPSAGPVANGSKVLTTQQQRAAMQNHSMEGPQTPPDISASYHDAASVQTFWDHPLLQSQSGQPPSMSFPPRNAQAPQGQPNQQDARPQSHPSHPSRVGPTDAHPIASNGGTAPPVAFLRRESPASTPSTPIIPGPPAHPEPPSGSTALVRIGDAGSASEPPPVKSVYPTWNDKPIYMADLVKLMLAGRQDARQFHYLITLEEINEQFQEIQRTPGAQQFIEPIASILRQIISKGPSVGTRYAFSLRLPGAVGSASEGSPPTTSNPAESSSAPQKSSTVPPTVNSAIPPSTKAYEAAAPMQKTPAPAGPSVVSSRPLAVAPPTTSATTSATQRPSSVARADSSSSLPVSTKPASNGPPRTGSAISEAQRKADELLRQLSAHNLRIGTKETGKKRKLDDTSPANDTRTTTKARVEAPAVAALPGTSSSLPPPAGPSNPTPRYENGHPAVPLQQPQQPTVSNAPTKSPKLAAPSLPPNTSTAATKLQQPSSQLSTVQHLSAPTQAIQPVIVAPSESNQPSSTSLHDLPSKPPSLSSVPTLPPSGQSASIPVPSLGQSPAAIHTSTKSPVNHPDASVPPPVKPTAAPTASTIETNQPVAPAAVPAPTRAPPIETLGDALVSEDQTARSLLAEQQGATYAASDVDELIDDNEEADVAQALEPTIETSNDGSAVTPDMENLHVTPPTPPVPMEPSVSSPKPDTARPTKPRLKVWVEIAPRPALQAVFRKAEMEMKATGQTVVKADFGRTSSPNLGYLEPTFKIDELLKEHDYSQRLLRCPWTGCNAILGSWYHLKRHVLSRHTRPEENYLCQWRDCDFSSGQYNPFRHHVRAHFVGTWYCPMKKCSSVFDSRRDLRDHIITWHTDNKTEPRLLSLPLGIHQTAEPEQPPPLLPVYQMYEKFVHPALMSKAKHQKVGLDVLARIHPEGSSRGATPALRRAVQNPSQTEGAEVAYRRIHDYLKDFATPSKRRQIPDLIPIRDMLEQENALEAATRVPSVIVEGAVSQSATNHPDRPRLKNAISEPASTYPRSPLAPINSPPDETAPREVIDLTLD